MPFFANATDFKIETSEMNDVNGNYTKNVTNSNTTNKDSGNVNTGSTVNQGNTSTQTATNTGEPAIAISPCLGLDGDALMESDVVCGLDVWMYLIIDTPLKLFIGFREVNLTEVRYHRESESPR
ncbi:hypothetical protein AX15_001869 [Amanita polypyramis BW_CC]|nr:hypothetical protein AX15_001869 [Amanita polypyramis BW_CC]